MTFFRTPKKSALCLKYFGIALAYTEAKKTCRDEGAYLINHELLSVRQILANDLFADVKRNVFGWLNSGMPYTQVMSCSSL